MPSLSNNIINNRVDLDAIQGTAQHSAFMLSLKGTMTRKTNIQVYPEGYGKPDYAGEKLEPVWQDVEDLSTIESFGFTKADFTNV